MQTHHRLLAVAIATALSLTALTASATESAPVPTLYTAVSTSTTASTSPDLLKAQIADLDAAISRLRTQKQVLTTQLRFEKRLKQGDKGEGVKKLQELLATDPSIYPEGITNGNFGPKTAKALKRLQEKLGLDPVGSMGPKTMEHLNQLLADGAGESGVIPPGLLKNRAEAEQGLRAALETGTIVARKKYVNGSFHIEGKLQVPTPCTNVNAASVLGTGSTSVVTIAITTAASAEVCAQMIAHKTFTLDVAAPEQTEFVATLNGSTTPIKFGDVLEPKFTPMQSKMRSANEGPSSDDRGPGMGNSGKILPIPPGFRQDAGTSTLKDRPEPFKQPDQRWWKYQATSSVATSTETHTSGDASASASAGGSASAQ